MQRELPILMTGPMVKATLRGDKTQTRRPDAKQKYAVGDLLYVRETWRSTVAGKQGWAVMQYAADGAAYQILCENEGEGDAVAIGERIPKSAEILPGRWRPSMHMPKWAARIWLEITGVRTERVQDISESDAIAEGIYRMNFTGWGDEPGLPSFPEPDVYQKYEKNPSKYGCDWTESPQESFQSLWETIYPCSICKGHCIIGHSCDSSQDCPECTKGIGDSWRANPVVFVYEFKIHQRTKANG